MFLLMCVLSCVITELKDMLVKMLWILVGAFTVHGNEHRPDKRMTDY
jgi:hypothetical protein